MMVVDLLAHVYMVILYDCYLNAKISFNEIQIAFVYKLCPNQSKHRERERERGYIERRTKYFNTMKKEFFFIFYCIKKKEHIIK